MPTTTNSAGKIFSKVSKSVAILLISIYQVTLSPIFTTVLGTKCRYKVSCSEYGKQAILDYGVLKGGILAVRRLLSCQPFGRIQQ